MTKQSVLLIFSLPLLDAIYCHANVKENEEQEDCGPDGYCFFLDMSSFKKGVRYYRGCDNVLMCEMLAESNSTMAVVENINDEQKIALTRANISYEWCAANVLYRGWDERMRKGTFCCCSTDFCNKKKADEKGFSEKQNLERLLDGTIEDYNALYEIAERLKMPGLNEFKKIK